jgi:hypothetical protein
VKAYIVTEAYLTGVKEVEFVSSPVQHPGFLYYRDDDGILHYGHPGNWADSREKALEMAIDKCRKRHCESNMLR